MRRPYLVVSGPNSITSGIDPELFLGLTNKQEKAICTLLARVQEATFRRGYQQGQECGSIAKVSGHDLRYGRKVRKLDTALEPVQGFRAIESMERLYIEHGIELSEIGLDVASHIKKPTWA